MITNKRVGTTPEKLDKWKEDIYTVAKFEVNRLEFEAWYKKNSRGIYVYNWHDDENRYSLVSEIQFAFEVWNAARGIYYPFITFRGDKWAYQ